MKTIVQSAWREARALCRSPWDLAMVTWVPLLAVALMAWIFNAGLPRQLPLGVVDSDGGALSRQLVRMLDATPGLQVHAHYTNGAEAARALRAMQVYGVVEIPRGFEATIKQGREVAEVVLLHNAQLSTHSSLLQRDVRTAVGTFAAGIEINARTRRGEPAQAVRMRIDPVRAQAVALFNVSGDYELFLGAALIPALLHILAMTAGAAGVGRELRDGSVAQWLGSAPTAVHALAATIGKLALPWLALTLVGAAALVGVTVLRGWHPPGSLAWVLLALALLVAVSLAAGGMLAALTRSMRTALSGAGFFAAPAFAFSGVAFPLSAMPPTARAWAEAMPYTHYIRLQMEQLQMGSPIAHSEPTVTGLLLATLVLLLLTAWGLARAARQPASWGGR